MLASLEKQLFSQREKERVIPAAPRHVNSSRLTSGRIPWSSRQIKSVRSYKQSLSTASSALVPGCWSAEGRVEILGFVEAIRKKQ